MIVAFALSMVSVLYMYLMDNPIALVLDDCQVRYFRRILLAGRYNHERTWN